MSIEETYYYGQCMLICECDKDSDNGKTVSATNGSRTFTGTVADKKCILTVPGKMPGNNNEYTVSLESEYSTTVKVGYGEVLRVPMAAGHDPLISKNLLSTIEEVEANTDSGMAVDALAVKEMNDDINTNINNISKITSKLQFINIYKFRPQMFANGTIIFDVFSTESDFNNGNFYRFVIDMSDKKIKLQKHVNNVWAQDCIIK